MNNSTNVAGSPAENAGGLVSTLGADQFSAAGAAATVISLPEKERPSRPVRAVLSEAHKSRGIPELDSPMAG